MRRKRVWFVSEPFHPEDEGVGWYMSRCAFGFAEMAEKEMAKNTKPAKNIRGAEKADDNGAGKSGSGEVFSVGAICTQPSYARKGTRCPKRELYRDVEIFRCGATQFDRQQIVGRLVNLLTMCLSMFFCMLWRVRRGDVVLVASSPPMLPFLAVVACFFRRARCVIWSFDVYPEIAVSVGLLRKGAWMTRLFAGIRNFFYRRADAIVTLGRDMKEFLDQRLNPSGGGKRRLVPVYYVPLFVDTQEVLPVPRDESILLRELGLTDRFVVQIAGNLGFIHDVGLLLEAARRLEGTKVHFLLFSSGKKVPQVEQAVSEEGRTNITVHARLPRERTSEIVVACDLALGPLLLPGMYGVLSPSRTYGILASGRPVLALTEENTEVDRQIRENDCGWSVRCGDVDGFTTAIREASANPDRMAEMGRNARRVAETLYTPERVIAEIARIVQGASL